ncbi:MAG: hypothetical protein ACO1PZ_01175 [Gammaproteobacteria bacterium]
MRNVECSLNADCVAAGEFERLHGSQNGRIRNLLRIGEGFT